MSSEHQLTDTDLATAIDAGEASGPAEPFDFDAFIAQEAGSLGDLFYA